MPSPATTRTHAALWCWALMLRRRNLSRVLGIAAGFDLVKGFAVGRTIFAEAARKWLSGTIDDAQAIAEWPARYQKAFATCGTRRALTEHFPSGEGWRNMKTVRLTAAQALVRYLANQMTPEGDTFIAGVWAIFGHGNVAGWARRFTALASICPPGAAITSRPWPMRPSPIPSSLAAGAPAPSPPPSAPAQTNMVTAAALAHVNRLPCSVRSGRCLRQSRSRSSSPADRGFQRRHHDRQRLFPPGKPLFRPVSPGRNSFSPPCLAPFAP